MITMKVKSFHKTVFAEMNSIVTFLFMAVLEIFVFICEQVHLSSMNLDVFLLSLILRYVW